MVVGEPDQFFFDFAGRSGQFAIGPTSTSTSVTDYRTFPQQKMDFTPVITGAGNLASITEWTVTTEDGTKDRSTAAETTTDYNASAGMPLCGSHSGAT